MSRWALAFAVLLAAACSSAKTYEMRGQVLAIDRDKLEILVKHEDIPGLMPAMTMPWRVETAALLDNLGTGDIITSEIVVRDNQAGVVTKITRLGTAKPDVPPPAGTNAPRIDYLAPGSEVPDEMFVDQEGRTRRFADIRGDRAVAVTFIYTQCPIPTFCPAMDRQFAEAQALIKERGLEKKAGLVSVSFDPKNDTPAVLKAHARELGSDPDVWTFVTANAADVDRFAASFGVLLVRGEAANPEEIGHTLRTAVVDRTGRFVKAYSGGGWTPQELVADLAQAP